MVIQDHHEEIEVDDSRTVWVLDTTGLGDLIAVIEGSDEVTFDLETTGLDPYARHNGSNGGVAARIVLASFTVVNRGAPSTWEPTTWLLPLSHPDSPWLGSWRKTMGEVAEAIVDDNKPLIGHNVKFDVKWVYAHCGVDMSKQIAWDTQISSHLLDETRSTKLKERAPATFDVIRWDDFDLKTPGAAEAVPLMELGEYAARDTYWTWRLAMAHRDQMGVGVDGSYLPETADDIENLRLGKLAAWVAMPTVATLTAIEQRGIKMDRKWVQATLDEDVATATLLKDNLSRLYPEAGLDMENISFAPTAHWFRDWAEAAGEAGDLTVAELTPTGKPKWSHGVLVRQSQGGSHVAEDLLTMRTSLKRAEFLRAWLELASIDDEIHTTYNSGAVSTGRLSSSVPNMQQVTAKLRPAFVPRDGYVFADLDFSQIELRVAAHIAPSQPMIEAFQRGDDLHTLLAAKITGKASVDVTPIERQKGKSANFGLLYGMGAFGFRAYAENAYNVSFSMNEAHGIYRAFFETWDGMQQWHARSATKVAQTGQVISPIGRVRRLPEAQSGDNSREGFAARAAVNSPVQGFASDLMQMAASSIEGNLPGVQGVPGARIVATVHDSIVVEVPEDSWQETTRQCADRMVDLTDVLARLQCDLSVPLAVEAKIGSRWGLSDIGTLAVTGAG